MKLKKTILGLAVVAVAGVNAFNAVSGEQSKLSDLQMENIERLALAEPGDGESGKMQDCGYSAFDYSESKPDERLTFIVGPVTFRYCGEGCPVVTGYNPNFGWCIYSK